jgi:carbon-monoxide dehydrogenase small subunit
MIPIRLVVDGTPRELHVPPGATLLEALRDGGVKSVKDGCATGDCGACAVLLDGRVVNSCFVFAARVDGSAVTTATGLLDGGELHRLQRAFLDYGAVQCGFCTPGVLLVAKDLLDHNPNPTTEEIRGALAGSYCRCTGYVRPAIAIEAVAEDRDE